MIGSRIKLARESEGLSQRALGELAEVSAMAISKYERDESVPSSRVLLALARALNVRVEYFFRQCEVTLDDADYRKHAALPAKEKSRILADVRDQIERRMELGEFLPEAWAVAFSVPKGLARRITDLDAIEDVAIQVRQAWDLGLNPIPDLIDTLEERGIKVFTTDQDGGEKFDGLAARVDGMPVIVVGQSWPGDRQRFTLAHELGHLILKGRLDESLDEEKACHRFAGAFLAPKPIVFKVLGGHRTWLEPRELYLLKNEFGLSMAAWSYRARDLGILPQNHMHRFWKFLRENGWHKKEPDPQYPHEKARRFTQLLYRALAEDRIGESKAAELLGISLVQLHACRNMECLDEDSGQ